MNPNQPNNLNNMSNQGFSPYPEDIPKKSKTPIIVLSVVIIIAIFGIIGAFMFGASTQKNTQTAEIASLRSENQKLAKQLEAEAVGTDKTSAFSYLDIKEWDIRMPLNDKYTDVVYRMKNDNGITYVELSSTTLKKIATCVNYNGELGIIKKSKAGIIPEPSTHVVGFDSNIYMLTPHTQTCTSNVKDVEAPFKASILEQFALLEKAPSKRIKADTN